MKLLATLAAATALATPAAYVQAHQRDDGGFGDAQMHRLGDARPRRRRRRDGPGGRVPRPAGAGERYGRRAGRDGSRRGRRPARTTCCRASARTGRESSSTRRSGRSSRSGRPGEPAPRRSSGRFSRAQRPSGGWSWLRGGAPDSNDTAAAIQALRAAGVRGKPIDRAVAFLRRHQNRRRRFRAHAGPGLGRALDRLGDPGACSPPARAGRGRVCIPAPAPASGRQRPLQRPLRLLPPLDDRAGGSRARTPTLPAPMTAGPVALAWSGGKDSALALGRASASGHDCRSPADDLHGRLRPSVDARRSASARPRPGGRGRNSARRGRDSGRLRRRGLRCADGGGVSLAATRRAGRGRVRRPVPRGRPRLSRGAARERGQIGALPALGTGHGRARALVRRRRLRGVRRLRRHAACSTRRSPAASTTPPSSTTCRRGSTPAARTASSTRLSTPARASTVPSRARSASSVLREGFAFADLVAA